MDDGFILQIRVNNCMFKCELDTAYYNLADTDGYAVQLAKGIIPRGESAIIEFTTAVICQHCWEANTGAGLNFQEPSKIVTPTLGEVQKVSQ